MHWNRWYTFKSYIASTVWSAPVVALLLEQIVFRTAYAWQLDYGWLPGFSLTREGAAAVADYVYSAAIAFIVFTFSSLLVAIQVASGQLTPRIIATALLRDRPIRLAVGIFVFALLLAVAVKSRIDTMPRSLISLMGVFGLLNVLVFMFLIDYAARFLRPVSIVQRIAQLGLAVIEEVYPQLLTDAPVAAVALEKLGPPDRTIVHRGTSAIVIAVNLNGLLTMARRADCTIEFVPRMGDFVGVGEPLFLLRGRGAIEIDDRKLFRYVAFGAERTIEQDSTFAFRVIVDIGLKAISKAINDPTTAVLAVDQLQRLLRSVGQRSLRDEQILDENGRLRVIFRTPNWADFVQLACTELRQYGAENTQVVRRMRAMIEAVMGSVRESRLPALRHELALLDRAIEHVHVFPEDVARARVADTQGLGGAPGP
jgi:uncharacterized membrane protein